MARGNPRQNQGRGPDRVQRKAAQVDRAATRAERTAARLSEKAVQLQQMSEWLAAFDMWTRPEPGARRPRLSRDDIAAAAVKIADAEGFDALSMRRLAAELDVGTMSLYHYVHTKDELLMLLNDAVMGEVVVPDGELPSDWRAAMMTIAHRTRATLLRHPWVLDLHDDPPAGPNSIRHYDQSMQAASGLDAPLAVQADLVATVDEYVFGYCALERQGTGQASQEGMLDYLAGLIESGNYPTLAAIRDRYGLRQSFQQIERARNDPARFERNLGHLLNGFASTN